MLDNASVKDTLGTANIGLNRQLALMLNVKVHVRAT